MSTSFIESAQAAFADGDYARAIALYEQAMLVWPELASMYLFNLNRAKDLLSQGGEHTLIPSNYPGSADMVFIHDLYREVEQALGRLPVDSPSQSRSLVSVVMTSHNVAEYIEQAVTSLVRQTHMPLEVIVVDDASTDDTWLILQRLSMEYPIVIRRLNTNLGTYFAKNYGVQLAQGEFIFFQDGDDLCHPERIRLSLRELQQPGTVCVQGCYSRVLFPIGQVLPLNGLVKKPGLITLGLKKSVFDEIGFFNCTTKASDDEFYQRLRTFYRGQPRAVRRLELPLYYSTLRKGSLFADMITNDPAADGCIEQRPSPVRQRYVEAFQKVLCQLPPAQYRRVFCFPVIRDLIDVDPEMTRLANPAISVVLSLCSIPERQESLRRTLASLAPQVDEIHVYLDRYTDVPDFVRDCHARVTVRLAKDLPGLRDNGKFVPLLHRSEECYFFTADDDIEYPPDYVNTLVKKIEFYGRLAVVGVHGVLIPERPSGYFSGFRRVLWFKRGLEQDQLVNNLGTGTVAFHSGRLAGMDYRDFNYGGMVDLYLAIFCKLNGIPMVAIARPLNWLVEMKSKTPNLFVEFSQNDEKQSHLVRQHVPWGYTAITKAVHSAARRPGAAEAGECLRTLLPLLPQCLA